MTDERSEAPARHSMAVPDASRPQMPDGAPALSEALSLFTLPCIQVRHMGGVWQVTKNGRFYGDFLKEKDALQAVKTAGGAVAPSP